MAITIKVLDVPDCCGNCMFSHLTCEGMCECQIVDNVTYDIEEMPEWCPLEDASDMFTFSEEK